LGWQGIRRKHFGSDWRDEGKKDVCLDEERNRVGRWKYTIVKKYFFYSLLRKPTIIGRI
jgi:hypothetical protein